MRSVLLAVLFIAAAAPAAGSTTTAVPRNVPSCAPLPQPSPSAKQHAPADKAAPGSASDHRKVGAADASDNDIDDDAKDFPPLKPGESFHLIGFAIEGSRHVDEDALIASLPEHVGDPISATRIKADTEQIKKALTRLHVHFAEVTTGLVQRAGPDHCAWVIWGIQHIDAFSQIPYQGFWKFGGQTFSGNKALSSEQLEIAVDLKLGDRVREGDISDGITGIQQAYDKVFPGKTVKVEGKLKLTLKPERVATFEWQIIEPPPK